MLLQLALLLKVRLLEALKMIGFLTVAVVTAGKHPHFYQASDTADTTNLMH
jgi:hypothetical protein